MSQVYAVHVSDDNGWAECCPDYCGVFFGDCHGGRYVGPGESDLGGHVEFDTLAEAEEFRADLDESGDWMSKRDGVVCEVATLPASQFGLEE